jgi:hypothetical protein
MIALLLVFISRTIYSTFFFKKKREEKQVSIYQKEGLDKLNKGDIY